MGEEVEMDKEEEERGLGGERESESPDWWVEKEEPWPVIIPYGSYRAILTDAAIDMQTKTTSQSQIMLVLCYHHYYHNNYIAFIYTLFTSIQCTTA